jgi:glutaconyl-CoA decarboxylase
VIYRVVLDGRTYEVEVEAGEARVVDEYITASGPAGAGAQETTEADAGTIQSEAVPAEVISSPVPGTVMSVEVEPGQFVKAGDTVIILEAMKMENEITASVSGTVTKVLTSKGAAVDTGAPLVVIG